MVLVVSVWYCSGTDVCMVHWWHWCVCGAMVALVSVWHCSGTGVCMVHWCSCGTGVCMLHWCSGVTGVCAAKPRILEIQIMFSGRVQPAQAALPDYIK